MKQQSRRWILASVAAALLFVTIIGQLDKQKLYLGLQQRLAQSEITLQADNISLSFFYMGSIRLDGVQLKTSAFQIQAERLFIDLNLAALLTGKALPQALYLQLANIDVENSRQQQWIRLIETENFKLKRVNISQSEIHFVQQHLTLEQVNLDIRDIGKNKNPRIELRAHIGDGRIDAHGYMHLKRGEITRGFSRIKLHSIPLAFLDHGTNLKSINGSITTHLNDDQTWQSFGHLSLQSDISTSLDLRGKVTGHANQLFQIEDLVLSSNDAGALQVTGQCAAFDSCQIDINGDKLKIAPIAGIFQTENAVQERFKDSYIQTIHLQNSWDKQLFTSSGFIAWQELDLALGQQATNTHLDAGKLLFEQLQRGVDGSWSVARANMFSQDRVVLTTEAGQYNHGIWQVPLRFEDASLWPALVNLIFNTTAEGRGSVTGFAELQGSGNRITGSNFSIDATAADIQWQNYHKPAQVNMRVSGRTTWQENGKAPQADITMAIADSYAAIKKRANGWLASDIAIDFNQFKELGITLPLDLHGYISGQTTMNDALTDMQQTSLDLIDFGIAQHHLNGQVNKADKHWETKFLAWEYNKNRADISSDAKGLIHINANRFDSEGLALLQLPPLQAKGTLTIKSLTLPFGVLKDVSAKFQSSAENIALKRFKATFYEGSLRAKQLNISQQDEIFHMDGRIQSGGIRLQDWRWLNNQFQTILSGSVYSTLNLDVHFDKAQTLTAWQGDGDLMVYNGKWTLNNELVQADKLSLSLRKRQQFVGKFTLTTAKQVSRGEMNIDEAARISGQLRGEGAGYQLLGTWPKPIAQQAE